ncbi:hypothetical protein [Natronorubrum sp. DTA7]|uniref:hypothetical protein n=1 Tax=Natronorubrum sp. DTA7 TaxID=3447016 RepID=UPI003F859A35
MDETVDVQATTIGVGTIVALGFFAYGRYIDGTIVGIDATMLATGAFAATFAAIALLHGAYGRRDFAVAHGIAAVGLGLITVAATGPQMLGGYLLLVGGGVYIALVTVRARDDTDELAG